MRNPDLLWDCWMQLAYSKPSAILLTRSERGRINSALKELREIGATPEELKKKWAAYKTKWPKLGDPSITALTGNWNSLETRSSPQASYTPPEYKRPTVEGYKAAIDLLPGHLRKRLEAKHSEDK